MPRPFPRHDKFVSIVVPILNESAYIERCLRSLLVSVEHAGLSDAFEILLMDGGSTDDTVVIVRPIIEQVPAVRLCANPGRLQSAAINLAAEIADPRALILMRADAHALYPHNFVGDCLAALREQDASSVVVPMVNRGVTPVQRAIAAAQSGRLGNGGSAHRSDGPSGFVDHGHHAAFDRAVFQRLGGYDIRFTHNEDAEYDVRLGQTGGRIWMCRSAPIVYFPRRSLHALAGQYFRHGRGRAQNLSLHGSRPKLRQIAPVGLLLLCAAGMLLTPWNRWFVVIPVSYASICVSWGVWTAVKERDPGLVAAGPALMIMHLCWGYGFLAFHARRRFLA